jgi:hypothetical protein
VGELNRSVDVRTALDAALEKVVEVMGLQAARVSLLSGADHTTHMANASSGRVVECGFHADQIAGGYPNNFLLSKLPEPQPGGTKTLWPREAGLVSPRLRGLDSNQ